MAWTAYRMLSPCLGALAPGASAFAPIEEQSLWGERLGQVKMEGGCHAWVHAASLGEASAVGPLLAELRSLHQGARFQLTATTRAGRGRLATLGLPTSLAPFDSPQAAKRFFTGVRPQRLILVETELWPQWLLRARADGVPVAVVSARLSPTSVRRYRRLGRHWRDLVAGLAAVLCQTSDDVERWLELGARPERTAATGNLKDDFLPPAGSNRSEARAALGLDPGRPLLVLGSIRPGEARVLARVWGTLPVSLRERWQVIAVPRHSRVADELRDEAARAGPTVSRDGVIDPGAWRWDDRAGVLNGYYAAADVAVVGGSLLPMYAGHNPLEPAAAGAAVVIGPHHVTQSAGVAALAAREAVWVADSERELGTALDRLLGDSELRRERAERARAVAEERQGAARRTVSQLVAWKLWPAA